MLHYRPLRQVFKNYYSGSDCKESACNAKDSDSVPGLEKSRGEGNDHAPQYSGILQIKHQGVTFQGYTNGKH